MNDIDRSKLTMILREIASRIDDPASRDGDGKPSTYELEQVSKRAKEGLAILKGKESECQHE